MSDRNTTTTTDDLAKVERSVFNSIGISEYLILMEICLYKNLFQQDESSFVIYYYNFHIFFR